MVKFTINKIPNEISLRIFVVLFHLLFFLQVNSYYEPTENFAVNCGYTGSNILSDNRTWVGDVDSNVFSIIEPQTGQGLPPSFEANATSFTAGSVPFSSARLSHSIFIYSFPVVQGPKFVRLYFYPTSYGNFEAHKSLFSVKVGNFTLLKDFNASRVEKDEQITREYCIYVEPGERLNVTFVPSMNHSDSYAFINGIEVVSMPPSLYYRYPNVSLKLVGTGDQIIAYPIDNYKALETLYRVNVGETQVPPRNDTGMFRHWNYDRPYLVKEYPQSIQFNFTTPPHYKNDVAPDYTAPAAVYLTARSYGKDATEDYNVTWEFIVNSEFTHMIRLHFCEFSPKIQQESDRAFQIFIADNLVEKYADVISLSGGNLIPVYRDYAVMMPRQGSSKKLNLSIKLQRLPKVMFTRYHDVILNGIEIFKISDENNNLAEPNSDPPTQQILQTQTSKHKKPIIVIITVAAVSGLVLASIIGIIGFRRRRRAHDTKENSRMTKTEGSSLPSHLCRYFTLAEIRAATNNLDDVFIVGVGGFGNVYKGLIDGDTPVAIKRLKPGSQQGANEFKNEIEMLSQLRHHNLVSLIGYCNDDAEMILVYDFMPRGTLREYLYGADNQPLSWKQRLEILLGAARGLQYLHAGVKHNIIHRDVKSTNILLDEKWRAKVSDFGLSKVGPTGMSTTHVSTIVKGSLGYLDPEYYKRQRLTLKSDVYSFGVVLLEVLCARPPLLRTMDKQKASLVDWFRTCYDRGDVNQTVDPFLQGSISSECKKCYCQTALGCLHDDGNQRPSMSDVVGALEFAMQLVESEENNDFVGTQYGGKTEERPLGTQCVMSDEGSDVRFTSSDTDEYGSKSSKVTTHSASTEEQPFVSATVFSEIGNPRPR
ncbi:receptor-like protein kinase FERONIA [Abrus precatorius]|uniref:Receptor-like protein kinase FERONIA n=1 Tax=Abrus precatorius TaxID=3816 RepID=A0A8B8L265_ABRPR|nr:receptor-like protein kinase FERONIA [Abrus precatorius]